METNSIKIHKWMQFTRVRGDHQVCTFCQEKLERGEYALSIRKDLYRSNSKSSKASQYNIWIHPECIEDFLETIKEGWETNKESIRSM